MLSRIEQVWRHLLVRANAGERRHSLTALAAELAFPKTTVHVALERPRAIGAVEATRAGIRSWILAVCYCSGPGNRDLAADVLFDTRALAVLYEVEDELAASFVLGGFAAYRLDIGLNTVADYDTVLAYGPPKLAQRMYKRRRSGRTRILVLEGDPLLATYGSHTPMSQDLCRHLQPTGMAGGAFLPGYDAEADWRRGRLTPLERIAPGKS